MSDDPMFQYVLARSRARETSILAVATIASSASVILLSMYFDDKSQSIVWIPILGIIFAGLGLAYREVTKRYIHQNDEDWLKEYINMWVRDNPNELSSRLIYPRCDLISRHCIENPVGYSRKNYLREFIIRLLFVIPIIAWIGVISVMAGALAIGISCFYTITLTFAE